MRYRKDLWLDDDTILVDTQEENAIAPVPTEDGPMLAAAYDIVFGNTPPSIVNFNSPLSDTSTGGFTNVNSKWNQPRKTGTNPHNGVDLAAAEGREVYAPYAGWLEHLANGIGSGNHNIQLLVDANNNQVKDDGDYYVRFYHMSGREPAGYKSQGDLIGRSGKEGTTFAHLHFGICSLNGGLKWLRNEVNYRHLSEDNWSAGKDLDIYSHVEWNNNTASLVAYAHDDEDKTQPLSEVRIYYRSTPTGTWINGGTMTKAAGANN